MRTGGCQCGALRYESSGDALGLYICHCLECRGQSASAFGISVAVSRAGLRVTKGTPKFWSRDADSGTRVRCAFSPDCGSRLWHERDVSLETLTIKGGSLDVPPDISAAIHIWTTRKMPGVTIPEGAAHFPEEPPE